MRLARADEDGEQGGAQQREQQAGGAAWGVVAQADGVRTGGDGDESECYWRNSAWMKVWETWLQHQKSLDQYRQSKEFLQLMDEVEQMLKK